MTTRLVEVVTPEEVGMPLWCFHSKHYKLQGNNLCFTDFFDYFVPNQFCTVPSRHQSYSCSRPFKMFSVN